MGTVEMALTLPAFTDLGRDVDAPPIRVFHRGEANWFCHEFSLPLLP